jgi:hypothetical protein
MINSVVEFFVKMAHKGNRIFGDLLDEAVDVWAFFKPGAYIFS